jgi:hypothetical protein
LFVLEDKTRTDVEKMISLLTTTNFRVTEQYCTQTAIILLEECEIRIISDDSGVYVNVIKITKNS